MGGCSGKYDAESVVPDRTPGMPPENEVLIEELNEPKEEPPPPVEEEERALGSQVYIHNHDVGAQMPGRRLLWLPIRISAGPRSKYISVSGTGKAYRPTDEDNNYLFDPETEPEAFDAIHTFAVVQRTLLMYKRALAKLPGDYKRGFRWPWGQAPLAVHPYAGRKKRNAYDRNNHSLSFFTVEDKVSGNVFQTCQTFGGVAHEAGHAILDAINPKLMESPQLETQAIQEAFADLTVLFITLDFMDMCDLAVSKMKGDLQNSNLLLQIAHEIGLGHGKEAVHSINKDLRVCEATEDRHVWSQVFTGAIYNILVAIIKREIDVIIFDPAATLYRSTKHVLSALLRAVIDAPQHATFRDLAAAMVNDAKNERFKKIMQKEFTNRQFFDPCAHPRPI